ncbi:MULTISPECIES: glycosyltransferase family 9 protein [Frankia]|uniref:Heptosyl transferase n=1 Tax=Frankia alni (strain DSM 45986 / CECT 9034 / ACN14a) TaxID=326424 RepID=Q0RIU3_FRAAA|nr:MULTISPECIES: glycosyltransferase family 9 protein [Frankia]CAJ62572.1 putative heptosyl transferase [Frankia alni ACN14a]
MGRHHPAAGSGGPLDLADARRILAVRPDNLGDVVLLTPALRALRAAAPAAELDLLTSPAGAAAVPLIDDVDEAIVARVCWQDAGGRAVEPGEQDRLVGALAARRYDAAVIFTSFSQSPWPAAFVCALAGIPVRVGASREFGGSLLTHWVDDLPGGVHQVDRALLLLRHAGLPAAGSHPRLTVPTQARTRVRPLVEAGPYAVLLPGASCSSRRYDPDRFAQVAGLLAGEGLRVLVAGTREEAPLVDRVRAGAGPAGRGLAGALDVPGLVALLSGAAVAVSNNSAGAHLADAVRAPVVTLFAGTEREAEYRPRAGRAVVLRRATPCSPCRAFTCPFEQECLDLTPVEVATAALGLCARGRAA